MSTLERNWLIRTTQNQILGPISKAKLVEFIQKGALGLQDEVSSGNGYWFQVKEQELVEKYLFGDIPQSFNPMSEAKSVYSRKDNPNKTTSLNMAPANKVQEKKEEKVVLPSSDDLDFPDMTIVRTGVEVNAEGARFPVSDDLEFPDLSLVAEMKFEPTQTIVLAKNDRPVPLEEKIIISENKTDLPLIVEESAGPAHFPQDDDLAFPDMPSAHDETEDRTFEVQSQVEVATIPLEEKAPAKAPIKILPVDERKILVQRKGKNKSGTEELRLEKNRVLKEQSLEKIKKTPDATAPRNDKYLYFILFFLVILLLVVFFYYYRFILNKPIPV